jgi:hypothetical protein
MLGDERVEFWITEQSNLAQFLDGSGVLSDVAARDSREPGSR